MVWELFRDILVYEFLLEQETEQKEMTLYSKKPRDQASRHLELRN